MPNTVLDIHNGNGIVGLRHASKGQGQHQGAWRSSMDTFGERLVLFQCEDFAKNSVSFIRG